MSKLGFTEEEQNYLAQIAVIKESRFGRVGFYSAVLVPAMAFGVYGLVRADLLALGLAFAALVYFSIWRIVAEVRHAPLYVSICSKVAAFERNADA
jgi:hypothetical protein